MKFKRLSAALALALSLVMLLSGFTNVPGLGRIDYESEQEVAPDTTYIHIIGENTAAGGIVSVHVLDADVRAGRVKPYVFNGTVTKRNTVSGMANVIASEGYKVVGGVNGDIYDTSSGTPRGAVIHDHILYTGGYQSGYLLCFDDYSYANLTDSAINYSVQFQKYGADGTTPEAAVENIDYFNVPHGGANGLHLFNSRYAASTKTSGTCAEVVLKVKDGYSTDLKIGQKIEAEVVSVKPSTKNTAIGAGQLVLSCNSKSAHYKSMKNVVPGTSVTINVSTASGSPLAVAKEAMGVYGVLSFNNAVWTTDRTLNPRTCVGIKSDGSVVLYVVDGRQSSVSKGMNAVDINSYLMSMGCISVVNMDGGGSTTMVARDEPGISNSAKVVNSPSDGTLRSVTNGLFFVYKEVAEALATQIAVYPEETLIMPGASIRLSAYGMNSVYEKADLTETVTWSTDKSKGSVTSGGLFTADRNAPECHVDVTATAGEINGKTDIQIVRDITFDINKYYANLKPGEKVDFNVTKVLHGRYKNVYYNDTCFEWDCTDGLGSIDNWGVFTASSAKRSASGNITVSYGYAKATIPVKIIYDGPDEGFTDIRGHWAENYINALADEGVIKGITATTFEPDSNLTRAQFLTLLSKIDPKENTKTAAAVSFNDVKKGDWFYDAVNWGVDKGIVQGMGDGRFAPNEKVSREQMCVMICNYYDYKKMKWEEAEKPLNFPDSGQISEWALAAVKKVVSEKIINGHADGRLDPLGSATRAEAAKIIYIVKGIFEYGEADEPEDTPAEVSSGSSDAAADENGGSSDTPENASTDNPAEAPADTPADSASPESE